MPETLNPKTLDPKPEIKSTPKPEPAPVGKDLTKSDISILFVVTEKKNSVAFPYFQVRVDYFAVPAYAKPILQKALQDVETTLVDMVGSEARTAAPAGSRSFDVEINLIDLESSIPAKMVTLQGVDYTVVQAAELSFLDSGVGLTDLAKVGALIHNEKPLSQQAENKLKNIIKKTPVEEKAPEKPEPVPVTGGKKEEPLKVQIVPATPAGAAFARVL